MSFISVFDVLGPNMIGPSSSHTAGAARIGFLAQKMIGGNVVRADFTLYGSFAKTYHGHGTDRALLGGIMGFSTDDMRIRNSFEIAQETGLAYTFTPNETETEIHPNTVDISMTNKNGQTMTILRRRQGPHRSHQWRKGRLYRRVQCHYRGTAGQTWRCCPHHQSFKRPWCQHRIHAAVPRSKRTHRLHDRRIRWKASGGCNREPERQCQRTRRHGRTDLKKGRTTDNGF